MSPYKVIQRINPNMILDLPLHQRSVKGRIKASDKLIRQFKKIISNIPEGELTINNYRDIIYSIVPIKPIIRFKGTLVPGTQGSMGTFGEVIENEEANTYNYSHIGYLAVFDIDKDKIKTKHSVLIHETRHLFDYMCSPKFMLHKNLNECDRVGFYNAIIDTKDMFCKPRNNVNNEKLITSINWFNKFTKINLLQSIRHTIQAENLAYNEEINYLMLKMFDPVKRFMTSWYYRWRLPNYLQYDKKVKIVEKMLKNMFRNRHSS